MNHTRRTFIWESIAAAGSVAVGKYAINHSDLGTLLQRITDYSHAEIAEKDEDFWYLIKQSYTVSANILNLNNGGVAPQPRVVQEAVERYNKLSNEAPSYYMWRTLDRGREPMRAKLADIAGCSPDEIAINRNASEALETVIFGLRLQKGDEIVLAKQDYPSMINAWKQRAQREGIILKWLDLDLPSEDEDEMAKQFIDAFSDKTKVVHITHVINWNGQILPVKKIAAEAQRRGIEVVVDGAHAFAHIDFKISDLKCDYYGTSLHKWLSAPFGSGMLYVRKEKIADLYPLLAAPEPDSDDIRKFEHLGTRSFAIEQAIGQATDFHNMIGSERKFARLHYLKNYWAEAVTEIDGVSVKTSLKPEFGGAIGLLAIEGKDPGAVGRYLFNKHKIHTTTIVWEDIKGVRITPNVYTVTKDLDRLIDAVKSFTSN
jgi:selenocysteine lyase/cysteine desulfurase